MSGETTQQDLVWVSPSEYESASMERRSKMAGEDTTDLPGSDLPAILIQNGLHLKQKGESQPFELFSYCPAPMMSHPIRVDWKIVTQTPLEGHHILCRQLQPKDDLPLIIRSCSSENTRGLIIITHNESYLLSRDYNWEGMESPHFPVCVLNNATGSKLLEVMSHHDQGELLMNILSKNMSREDAMKCKSPSPEDLSLTLEEVKGKHKRLRLFNRPKSDLKKRLKEMMTSPSTGPYCLSENRELFKRVMEEFFHHEESAKGKDQADADANSRVFQKLIKFIAVDEVFRKDVLFYVSLAYRVFKLQQIYACEELSQYIRKVIVKFEEMMEDNKLEPIMKFIEGGDLLIHFEEETQDATCSLFNMLEKACIVLMKESQKMKSKGLQGHQHHKSLLCKMLWLSVSLKFKSLSGLRDGKKVWYDHIAKEPEKYTLDAQSVEDFLFGLKFGIHLKLPVESSFNMEALGALMASGNTVRHFSQLSFLLKKIEGHLHVPEEFLEHIIKQLREPYSRYLEPASQKLEPLSQFGNLLGAIQEGLTFLDTVIELWNDKNWKHQSFDAEMFKWVEMLLNTVNVSVDKASSYVKEFVNQMSHPVCAQYQKQIVEKLIESVRNQFPHLSILKFSRLFKTFFIWPSTLVKEYLFYFSQRIPGRMNIHDSTWVDFLSDVVERFPGAENHTFILEFLTYVGEHYLSERRPKDFIFHLLSMNIPGLFVVEPGKENHAASQGVPISFKTILREYIQRNRLSSSVVSHVTAIWKSVSDMSEFQLLVLSVVEKELIPESRNLQEPISTSVKNILEDTVNLLAYDASWLEELSLHHKFAFGVVSVCCSLIPVAESLDWTLPYSEVVKKLGAIFSCYCKAKGLDEEDCILKSIPEDISKIACDEISTYFQWVIDIQQVISRWKKSFTEKSLTYDSIQHFNHFYVHVSAVGQSVLASSLVYDMQLAKEAHNEFLKLFEQLNIHLIKYIAGQPEASWLTLPSLLAEYGIEVPEKILVPLSSQVVFPGETEEYTQIMCSDITPSVTGAFRPGHDVSLKLGTNVTQYQISKLVHDLNELLSPIKDNLDLLIYFFLHKSAIFDTYLRYQLRKYSGLQPDESVPVSMQSVVSRVRSMSGAFFNSIRRGSEPFKGISWQTLAEALTATKELVLRLVEGTAQYSEVTAGGNLALERMDIEFEFKVLVDYTKYLNGDQSNYDGLRGIQCMLELFQYTHHINNVYNVCEQYHMTGCLEDEKLIDIKKIANELKEVSCRDQLTSKDAIEKVEKIVSALRLKKRGLGYDKSCLLLFPAIADSTVFYQFIKDKQFYGVDGQEVFRQQYELITAQLQHEEYNEIVLNHLLIAFQYISPFVDDAQDFEQLMKDVQAMKISSGCQELETVNKNINLVKLWFSRAEEDTLEMVPAELESILSTGEYLFVFDSTPDGVKAQLFLEYQPPSVSQAVNTTPGRPSIAEIEPNESILSHRDSFVDEISRSTPYPRESFTSSPPPAASSQLRLQRWNSAQIRDFEQRIGFLDSDQDLSQNIKKFLMFNQNAYKLLELYQRLNDLGHPLYTELEPQRNMNKEDQPKEVPVPFRSLSCSFSEEIVKQKVQEAEGELQGWMLDVDNLHIQFHSLLFFSIPKLRHIHKRLVEGHIDNIVGEISFLFKNNVIVREKMKSTVKSVLPRIKPLVESCTAPIKVVGTFLLQLFEQDMSRFALQTRHPYRQLQRTLSAQSATVLHSCHGLSPAQLVSLIINCYNGVPESFQLFHCQATTTSDELNLFLKRVNYYSFQYMIIGVERLPYQLQESLLQFQIKSRPSMLADGQGASLHFVETGPSILREMPWIMVKDHKDGVSLNYDRAKKLCRQSLMAFEDFQCITLVYGHAGDGKSHFIKTRLRNRLSHMVLHIPINEAFTPLSAIKKLQTLPMDTRGCCIYFNFTVLSPSEASLGHVDERQQYNDLMKTVNWFFFDLLVLGYVEDPTTGESFRFPGGLSWGVFIEVPSCRADSEPNHSLSQFLEHVPVLGLVGNKEYVEPKREYRIDDEVQLVCKYLKAFETFEETGKNGINKLYRESHRKGKTAPLVKFSEDSDLEKDECVRLLNRYTPEHMKYNKTTQKLFVSYMMRRCHFLDNLPAYNYNTGGTEMITTAKGKKIPNNTHQLGSTLMKSFLKEVSEFCDPDGQADWSKKPHEQLIYDTVDGGSSIGLISLRSEKLREEEQSNYEKIGIQIPSIMDMHSRAWLDDYLSRALTVPLDDNGRLKIIDESSYVLTLDYTLKMLNVHERHECGMPVIIEGETGVGKTALIEVLSKLWNSAHLHEWNKTRDTLLDFMQRKMDDLIETSPDHQAACLDVISNLSQSDGELTEEDLVMITELPDSHSPSAQFHSVLLKEMMKLKDDPVLALLELPDSENKKSFNYLFRNAEYKNNAKATAELLHGLFTASVKTTFHKLNVHAALKPSDIMLFFKEVSNQAYEIEDAYSKSKGSGTSPTRIPAVTVFLDEINTASCLGLLKEIIVDRSIDGTVIPSNVFIIGACNPHRGDSLAVTAQDESWIRSNYYVRVLHPTLDLIKWDYGSLDEYQERDYINAKLRLMHQDMENLELASLAELIITSQNKMRALAYNQLRSLKVDEINASICSKSSVSQRDIQRVFTFYEWLMKLYNKLKPYGPNEDYHRTAIMVSLSLVYYMRLNDKYRESYREMIDKSGHLSGSKPFADVFQREIDWYIDNMYIPHGIAKTQALKENIFGIILCTMTHTPLIIVGPPGCSKTLSFNLVTSNLRGQESRVKLFRETDLFHSLDPHYYQCSRRTTSNEIQTVFSRSINRQRTYASVPLPIHCVVFMDEAGLPEESLESLKVLHYHLDRREVSFVAISNHMLDASKTNRAVSLFRSEPSVEELCVLAKGCLCDTPDDPPPELKKDIDLIVKFCPLYHKFMERSEFRRFYGLRDFIHFINFLKRKRGKKGITDTVVMHALERNFNGHKMFDQIAREFLGVMGPTAAQHVTHHSILEILYDSIKDQPQLRSEDNEVRYKLVIDSSEDNSLLRLLFAFGVLKEKDTRTYMCSDFPGDSHQQTINTIAAIRHSAAAGHTVIMSQTDELHESFYDLFNQRFRRIDDPKTGPRFYANIAIGAHHKPCRVHPGFQCVVVVKASEVDDIPHPFLNRFEKYSLTHKTLLDAVLRKQPSYLRSVIQRAYEKATEFVDHVDGLSSLYGFHDDTLDSLVLSILPPVGFQEFLETDKPKKPEVIPQDISPDVFLVKRLLRALRKRAGFRIPHFTREELLGDVEHVMQLVSRDSQFAGQLSSITNEEVLVAVPEALQGLYHSKKGGRTDLSINACMVISVFLQWLVRHLCKRLMQLMTTEALTARYRSLPHPYTESYLKHQSHFNLHALIDKQLQVMDLDDRTDRSTTGTANRLLIFTRSSALIHQLPPRYPVTGSSSQLSGDCDDLIRNLVYYYTEDVALCKLSSITSQASMNDVLNSFWLSKKQRVMLLIANMKETSPEMISHLRVMIEENDTGEKLKLFVVLLHFPPSMFTTPCYPALFSNTWDHHYLDIIGQNTTGQVMDICEWLSLCCSYLKTHHSSEKRVSMHLSSLLSEAIPTISSRVFFGKVEDAPFNCPMDAPKRNKAIQALFDTGVGKILCDKFLKYWEPGVMLEYLEKAAAQTTAIQTSTLSITDSVQRLLRDTFFDYIVYMISKMNENMNIDILMDPDCSEYTRELFLSLLRSYPMPKLSQLKTLSSFEHSISSLESSQSTLYVPKFPFYRMVSSVVEKIIDQTRKEINQRLDTLHEFPDPIFSISQMSITSLPKVIEDKSHLVISMQHAVETMVKQILESSHDSPLKIALQAMMKEPKLMKDYSEAFTHQKLRLGSSTAGISYRILRLTFTQLHPNQELLTRLVLLHVCMHVYQLDLSRLVQVLRPIDTLLDMAATVTDDPFAETHPSPTASFLSAVQESGDLLGQPGDLSKYVLRILFSALAGSMLDQANEDNVILWYEVYRDVMSMSAVKDYLYKNLSELSATQHNIMQATFLVIQGSHGYDEKESFLSAVKIFNALFSTHLTERMEMKTEVSPRLKDVVEVIIEELTGSSVEVALQDQNTQLRRILEGLFNHYFSMHLPVHNAKDIQWFLEMVNKNAHWKIKSLPATGKVSSDAALSLSTDEPENLGCISMSVYHYYLTIILDKADVSNVGTTSMTTLTLYKPWVREIVGTVLVNDAPASSTPGPYIPTFYQSTSGIKCPTEANNKMMQQPLAHLYFLTVLRHLLSNDFGLTGLVRVASAISENLEEDTKTHDKVLHNIEKQAVVQAAIQQLAKCLNPNNPSGVGTVATIMSDINHLLDDESLGGGNIGGHGLALSLCLLKELSSYKSFTDLLGPNSFCKDFNVLVQLSTKIELPEEEHLFPFLVSAGKGNVLKDLYDRVGRAMITVHNSGGRKLSPLTSVAQEWSQGQVSISLPDGHEVQGERSSILRMILWLNTYYKFYCQKKTSTVLVDVMNDQLLYAVQPAPLNNLICCFLDPSKMTREATLDSDSSSYDDPIHAFFNPDTKDNSPSDMSLRHAIANLIAVVFAAPTSSTHLWYHMFASDQLSHTHIAGSMLETPVGQNGLFYDAGVQLTPNGLYGQQSYLKHATRGTLSLQSLYLLLWANAGSFCVGLLTDSSAEDKMKGSVFPEDLSIRSFCMKQLKSLWGHLSGSMGISVEERSFLVSRSMWNLLKFACGNGKMLAGRFTTITPLNNYESTWYNDIFMPVWNTLKDEYCTYSHLNDHEIFKQIKDLECYYPCFTNESALLQSLLSNTNIGDYISSTEHLLAQLVLQRNVLEMGGMLLTDLVELYQWLHQELAHVVTQSDAETIPVSRAVRVLAKSYSPEEGERLQNLYKRLRDCYNQYQDMKGNNGSCLQDTTPLCHVLSYSTDGVNGPDLLYVIISDIITTHNNFLMRAESIVRSDTESSLARYLPKELPRVHPTEFTDQNCIVEKSSSLHGLSEFEQLIGSRSTLPSPLYSVSGCHTSLPCWQPSLINLQQLQEDVFSTHVAGKPLIGPPQSLRANFAFRDAYHTKENLSAIEADLETITSKLLDEFKCPMDENTIKVLEQQFHNSPYHVIMETVSGLRGVAGHLIKKLMGISQSDLVELNDYSVADFLSSVFETREPLKSITGSKKSIFHEIAIHNLTVNQFAALENLHLCHLHDALRWFVVWVSQGWYEFCSLPYATKIRLSKPDVEALNTLPDHYTESMEQLLKHLRSLVMVLSHFESTSTITSMALKDAQMSIVDLLSRLGECCEQEDLIQLIPESILLQNYVHFRVVLKKLISDLQKKLSSESLSIVPHKKSWEDFVDDLWKNNLTQFRHGNFSYAVVSTADQKRRVYSLRNIDRNDEDLLNDLMNAGVSETNLLPDTDVDESSSRSPSLNSRLSQPSVVYTGHDDADDMESSIATSLSTNQGTTRIRRLSQSFTSEKVCEFLDEIGLKIYVPQFEEYGITGEILLDAEQGKGLEDLGVDNPLHRLKICVFFRRKLDGVSKIAKRYPVEEVVRFLHSIKMSEHVQKFEENKIDGELLVQATHDALACLGVTKQIQRITIMNNFKNYIFPRSTTL